MGEELRLKSDTAKRKRFFTPESFSHPAKCHLGLLEWIVFTFTQEGDVVLDPMLGSGTTLYATLLGRSVIGVELEGKFVKMAEDNLKKLNQMPLYLGTKQRGQAQIIQGDCRDLEGILVDAIVTSPPYAEQVHKGSGEWLQSPGGKMVGVPQGEDYTKSDDNIANLPYGNISHIVTSPPYEGSDVSQTHMTSNKRGDKGNPNYRPSWRRKLAEGYAETKRPYHEVDSIVTSPPYAESQVPPHTAEGEARRLEIAKERGVSPDKVSYMDYTKVNSIITSPPYAEAHDTKNLGVGDGDRADLRAYSWLKEDNPSNIGNLRYGNISHIVTSPPYEATVKRGDESPGASGKDRPTYQERIEQTRVYSNEGNNIGNLKGDTYLEAMLQVYQSCFAVLCDGGLMILVVKNFLREQKEVDLRGDTQQLAERAGFSFVEEHHRILPAQSFWRVIYTQRFPNAPKIDREFVLVFRKSGGDE